MWIVWALLIVVSIVYTSVRNIKYEAKLQEVAEQTEQEKTQSTQENQEQQETKDADKDKPYEPVYTGIAEIFYNGESRSVKFETIINSGRTNSTDFYAALRVNNKEVAVFKDNLVVLYDEGEIIEIHNGEYEVKIKKLEERT